MIIGHGDHDVGDFIDEGSCVAWVAIAVVIFIYGEDFVAVSGR